MLNCVTLWNTVYLDRAVNALREQGYPMLDEDVARLSAYIRKHINVHGHYSFQLPELGGGSSYATLITPTMKTTDPAVAIVTLGRPRAGGHPSVPIGLELQRMH